MYLYVTSNVNNGHKIGITEDLFKRKKQYNTIFPDLEFLITIFSHDAAFIEESFKQRFFNYRKYSGNSDRKSEIYTLYFKIIAEHIIRCHHAVGKALLIPYNHLDEYYTPPFQGSTSFYLSHHYFLEPKDININNSAGVRQRLEVGEIYNHVKKENNKEIYGYLLKYINLDGFKTSINSIKKKSLDYTYNQIPHEEMEEMTSFGKIEEVFFSEYYQALNYLQEKIFEILLQEKILRRPFDLEKVSKFKRQRGFIYQRKAYYHENIFFGKNIGNKFPIYRNFNLGINDERTRNGRKEIFFPKELKRMET